MLAVVNLTVLYVDNSTLTMVATTCGVFRSREGGRDVDDGAKALYIAMCVLETIFGWLHVSNCPRAGVSYLSLNGWGNAVGTTTTYYCLQ